MRKVESRKVKQNNRTQREYKLTILQKKLDPIGFTFPVIYI